MRKLWYRLFPRGRHARHAGEIAPGADEGAWEYTDMFEYIKEPDPDHSMNADTTVLSGQDPEDNP